MALELMWRLGRLRSLLLNAWLHLRREGPRRTASHARHRLHERLTSRARSSAFTRTAAADGADQRPHVLIVDALMPDPSRDSGSVRLCNLMQILIDMGWRVDFMPDNLRASAAEKAAMDASGVQLLCRPGIRSLAHWLQREGSTLDAVILCRYYVAGAHAGLVRRHAPAARLCFDTVDLHHLRETRAAAYTHASPRQLRQVQRVRQQELALVRTCDVTFVVSAMEKQLLERDVPGARVRLLSNIHHTFPDAPGFEPRRDLVFVGGWGHPPNRDAIRWLANDIMPRIRQHLPSVELHLVGDLPTDVRAGLQRPGIRIDGRVPDIAPMMRACRVAVAPLRYGAGVKGKINTAMSYGLPVVGTNIAVEGMYLADGRDVLVADGPDAFAAQIARLYDDADLWQALSNAGMDNVQQHFSFECARLCLESVLGTGVGT